MDECTKIKKRGSAITMWGKKGKLNIGKINKVHHLLYQILGAPIIFLLIVNTVCTWLIVDSI